MSTDDQIVQETKTAATVTDPLMAQIKRHRSADGNQTVVDDVAKRIHDKVWLESPVKYLEEWKKARKASTEFIIKPDDYSFPIMVDLYHWQQVPVKLQALYPFGQYHFRVDKHRDFGNVYWIHMQYLADAPSEWFNADGELLGKTIAGNRYDF